MALTQLTDAIDQEIYRQHFLLRTKDKSKFFNSGVVAEDVVLTEQLRNSSGCDISMPFWNDLEDLTDPQISSDDPASACDPCKATMGEEKAIKHTRTKQWSAASLVKACVAGDPLDVFTTQSADWWSRALENHLLAQLTGIFQDNAANNGGDMIFDAVTSGTTTEFNAQNFISALSTMGDCSENLSAIAMHSAVYHNLLINNIVSMIPESETNRYIPTYMGAQIIVDDSLPVISGSYISYLFGPGAFSYAAAPHSNPVVYDRDECAGNGEGVDTLYTRHHYVLHPRGFSYDRTGIAGNSPDNTEEENPIHWTRIYPRKNIPLAALITTG